MHPFLALSVDSSFPEYLLLQLSMVNGHLLSEKQLTSMVGEGPSNRKEKGRLHLEESRRKFHEDQLVRKEEERKKEKEHRERLRVLQEESRERAREPVTVLLQREGREYNDHQGSVRGNTRKSISNKGRERGVRDIDKLEARQLRKFGVVIRPRELPSAAHSSDDDDEDNA